MTQLHRLPLQIFIGWQICARMASALQLDQPNHFEPDTTGSGSTPPATNNLAIVICVSAQNVSAGLFDDAGYRVVGARSRQARQSCRCGMRDIRLLMFGDLFAQLGLGLLAEEPARYHVPHMRYAEVMQHNVSYGADSTPRHFCMHYIQLAPIFCSFFACLRS
jgi:hypothetical protein